MLSPYEAVLPDAIKEYNKAHACSFTAEELKNVMLVKALNYLKVWKRGEFSC
jgi:hypothetical protein